MARASDLQAGASAKLALMPELRAGPHWHVLAAAEPTRGRVAQQN